VTSVAVSPDGKLVVSASGDRTIRLWDGKTGSPLRTLRGHPSGIYAVALSRDGRRILSGSDDGTIRLWDVATGRCIKTLRGGRQLDAVTAVAFTPDGQHAVSGSYFSHLRRWDLRTGKPLRARIKLPDVPSTLALSRSGRQLLAGTTNGHLQLFAVKTGKLLHSFAGHRRERAARAAAARGACPSSVTYLQFINHVAIAPGGVFAASAGRDREVRIWHLPSGSRRRGIVGHRGPVTAVVFVGRARYVMSASGDQTIRAWDTVTGRQLEQIDLAGRNDVPLQLAITPDGRKLVVGTGRGMVLIYVRSP
jgi:WD40 repeat protein